jgi:cysteine-rich repeat protein
MLPATVTCLKGNVVTMLTRRNTPGRRTLRAVVLALPFAFLAPASAAAICGDTVVDVGEDCDDGNVSDGDCCSASCVYEPSGTPCGNPVATSCSDPDTCDDLGDCDEKNLLPGTSCEDDFLCTTGDTCSPGGVCHAGPFPSCDDGIPCTANECEPETGECTFAVRPADGCKGAGQSSLSLSTRGAGNAKWKWSRGEATSCEDFGSPDADTSYDLCIFDGAGGGTYELAAHFALPASGSWKRASSCRWTYKDRTAATDGITSLKLTPRDTGRASIQFSAEGEAAPLPVPVAADRFMASDPDVTVQIINSNGTCWESRLADGHRNSGDGYKGTQ